MRDRCPRRIGASVLCDPSLRAGARAGAPHEGFTASPDLG